VLRFDGIEEARAGWRVRFIVRRGDEVVRIWVALTDSGLIRDLQSQGPSGDRIGTTGNRELDREVAERAAEELARAKAAADVRRIQWRRARGRSR
jgi:hypothetical protein